MPFGDVTGIGWRADAARRDGVVHARVLAALSASLYVDAAGEVLWIGEREATPHARAIHVAAMPEGREVGASVSVAVPGGLVAWRPADGPTTAEAARALRRGAARLAARAAAEAATALLGLGPGMTPAGDDFVGGAFFARALLARAGACDAAGWRHAADAVRAAAARLTHPIGAALLGDLLVGEGWAALHDLAAALARDHESATVEAARRLTRLGHSSGWDLLAGFVAGARG